MVWRDDLIFDVGMHVGQDTAFYLAKGFRVVAIEANPFLAKQGKIRFKAEVDAGRLVILDVGVGIQEGIFPFYINSQHDEWSSFDKEIGSRGGCKEVIEVSILPFETLIDRYGTPYYLKIDIEGYDFVVLQRLALTTGRPKFISAENGGCQMLNFLVGLGYKGYKFINQAEVPQMRCPTPCKEGLDIDWAFPLGASGPFGEDTPGEWKTAEEILIEMNNYWDNPARDPNVHGWFDLHAKLG
jgi:FkbM family methyltransferase